MIEWLAFTPRNALPRSADRIAVGAHAFSVDLPRSLCGLVPRERAGDPVECGVKRCSDCAKREAKIEAKIVEQTRHDVAESVARHAALEDLPLTSSDALLVGLGLERAAVLVGQREAAWRDREMAKRDRGRLRKLLGVRDPARRR